jgi:YfiH family protein
MINRVETKAGVLYQSQALAAFEGLCHGFGTRGVSLKDYLNHIGVSDWVSVKTSQKHGNRVHILDKNPLTGVYEGDAFVTASRGVVCFVRTADCVPVLLYDPERNVAAAVHAGWRGTACDVSGRTVRSMAEHFGCNQACLIAVIGPCICAQCYSVGEEVIDTFSKRGFAGSLWRKNGEGLFNLDLQKANRDLLLSCGLKEKNIIVAPLCTSCHREDFASYRRDRGEKIRQVNFIFIK